MKIQLFLFVICSFSLLAQSPLKEAQKLIKARQYAQALKVLDQADPENNQPEILYLKNKLYLNYYIKTDRHQKFVVQNLKASQSIEDLRKDTSGDYTWQSFKADSLIKRLLQKDPANFELHYSLGRYYQECYLKHGKESALPESMLLKFMEMHFRIAYQNGISEAMAAYGIGFARLMQEDYQAAIPYLKDCSTLNPKYAPGQYNLAYALLKTQKLKEVIAPAKQAFRNYETNALKADAASLIAGSYMELDSFSSAIKYYRFADSLRPQNYFTLKNLLILEMEHDSLAYPHSRKLFFQIGPDKPNIYQELLSIHNRYSKEAELLDFFQNERANYQSDTISLAYLHLFSAVIQKGLGQEEAWPPELEKAQKAFKSLYPPGHKVFVFIRSYFKKQHGH